MRLRDNVPGPDRFLPKQVVALADAIEGSLPVINVKTFGAVGDGVTDDTAAIQAAIDFLDTNNLSGTIHFPDGIYIIDGPFLDTSNSNAQILLPRRASSATSMISIMLTGSTPAPTYAVKRNKGAVLLSTLTSGAGSIIGGKVSSGAWPIVGNSWCSIHLRNLTVRAQPNPTYSGVDLRYYPNLSVTGCQISTDEDVISVASNPPVIGITEPTTATSYGLMLPPANLPDQAIVDNVQVYGFYNGILSGELVNGDNTLVIFCKVGVEFPGALHRQDFNRLYISDCVKRITGTGSESYVNIQALSMEHNVATPAWAQHTDDIYDPNNYMHGTVRWHLTTNGTVVNDLIQTGAFYLWTESLGNFANLHTSSPMVQVHNTANISIANNTLPAAGVGNVTFNTDLSDDPFGIHSTASNTDRLTPPKEGIVYIKFHGVFAANANGTRQVRIYKHTPVGGGAEILLKINNYLPISGSVDKTVEGECMSRATIPGEYFYIVVFQDSGAALDLLTGNYFSPVATLSISR